MAFLSLHGWVPRLQFVPLLFQSPPYAPLELVQQLSGSALALYAGSHGSSPRITKTDKQTETYFKAR